MADSGYNKLEVLGAVLIVLSLLLLLCSCKKDKDSSCGCDDKTGGAEGMLAGGYMYGSPRWTDGFTVSDHMPGLKFKKNLNEVENYVVNRHPVPVTQQLNVTQDTRWQSESFVSGRADDDQYTSGYDSPEWDDRIIRMKKQELIGDAVVTPMLKADHANQYNSASTGSMQLMHSEGGSYAPRHVTI